MCMRRWSTCNSMPLYLCVFFCSREGSCGAAPQPNKRKQSTRIQDEEPPEEVQDEIDKSMGGVEYEEDGTLWKILQVQWDADQCAMVVMYYDLKAVEDHGIVEDELLANESYMREYAKLSSLREVRGWVAESSKNQ